MAANRGRKITMKRSKTITGPSFDTRVDNTIAALIEAGISAQRLTGSGIILAGFGSVNLVLLVKVTPELSPDALGWLTKWSGPAMCISSPAEGVRAVKEAAAETVRTRSRGIPTSRSSG
jgi:hypothetical protein